MAFQQNPNSGSLFRNDRKQQQNQPDHTGTCLVDGKEYYLSAWIKQAQSGSKFFSLSFTPKETQESKPAAPPANFEDFDDDIPFDRAYRGMENIV